MDLDPTRLRVMNLIQERGTDLKNASLAIGRNAAYLHQYVTRGVPKVLPEAPLLAVLIQGLRRLSADRHQKNVSNVLHIDKATALLVQAQGALVAGEWHSIWTTADFADWADYVARLHKRKRYQLLKERRQAESHGLTFKVLKGSELTDEVLADYYEGHRRVCKRYGGKPWLPPGMYEELPRILPEATRIMGYFDGSRFIAGTMQLHAAAERTLYLLQNSEITKLNSLQLDLICYRPIEYALGHGIVRIDSGLAAQHKQHRGWQKTPVYHAHWFHNDELQILAQTIMNR